MRDESLDVLVEVVRPDGTRERIRVGTARRVEQGLLLQLGELMAVPADPGLGHQEQPPRRSGGSQGGGAGQVTSFPPYGRSRGAPIRGASQQDLEFYANGARRTLGDPSKARFHEKERALLAAIEAELARQAHEMGGELGPGHEDEEQY